MSHESPAPSPKRRAILAGLAVGVCATAVGLIRFGAAGKVPLATTPSNTKTSGQATPSNTPVTDTTAQSDPLPLPDKLSREWFLPHLKSRFSISRTGGSAMDITLVDVSPESSLANGPVTYAAFSILFHAPQGTPSEDGIYRIRHQELGEMDLFLSPVGRYADQVRYEAAFTRKA